MSGKTFKLEIVTPKKIIFSDEVLSFTAPGEVGSFQVLFNHAPLLSSITIGEVVLRDAQGIESRFATSGGFVEVRTNQVIMLAATAESSDQIDVQRAERARSRAEERLKMHPEKIDIDRARIALARALNRLRIAQRG